MKIITYQAMNEFVPRGKKISAFPTQERNGKTVFRYSEKGMAWCNGNTLGIQHIYPAGAIGLDSEWLALKTAIKETITLVPATMYPPTEKRARSWGRATCFVNAVIGMAAFACGGAGAAEAASKAIDSAAPWELTLSGDDWKIASFEPGKGVEQRAFAEGFPSAAAETVAAAVPGDVHWDLERAGKIPPVFYGQNSRQIGWVAGREWWYRKTFAAPASWQGKTVRLRFEGVDYLADVWLNGKSLGRHEGQFTPFEFDVSQDVRSDGENVLAVLIHPAPKSVRDAIAGGAGEWGVMERMRPAYPYWKCMTNAGWDWGMKIITMGIWKDVRLTASAGVAISEPIVLPRLAPPYDRATLDVRLKLTRDQARAVELTYRVRCLTAAGQPTVAARKLDLAAGEQPSTHSMDVAHPQLWWPNGYGKQHLYELEVTVRPAGESKVLDRARATFGIRDLKMLQNPEAADNTEYIDYSTDKPVVHKMPSPPPERKYLIQINGRKIFARGGNWIPCDLLYGRPRKPFYEHLIRSAAECNYNLFRIWGGGLIEKPEFFDLCDRYGIMLFAEFPNGGVRLPETDAALAIAAKETREILPLEMNHPCVVRYGGGNEWYRDAKNSRQMAQLRKICNETDPSRPYHDPDPEVMAQRHGPHGYVYPEHYQTYNTGRPPTYGPDNPIEWTEYGAAGAASVETLKSIMPAEDLWPVRNGNPYWIWHKAFHAYGADNWIGSAQYHRLFGPLPDLETTVRCSQFVQAEALRYANQAMRRYGWHRSGCASWTYNEPWPNAAHGCIIEYSGRVKMAYYYTRQAYAPVDVLAVYSNLTCEVGKPAAIDIWATQDGLEEKRGWTCRYRIYNLCGDLLAEKTQACSLLPESSGKVMAVDWTPPAGMAGDVALVWLELLDAAGKPAAQNLYTFGFEQAVPLKMPKALSLLDRKESNPDVPFFTWATPTSPEGSYDVIAVPDSKGDRPVWARIWRAGVAGRRNLFGSWGACPRHTEKARFVIDLDGDFATPDDQTVVPINETRMADQITPANEPGAWSGFRLLGAFDLQKNSAVRLEAVPDSKGRHLGISLVAVMDAALDPALALNVAALGPQPPLAALLKAPRTELKASRVKWREAPNGDREGFVDVQNTGNHPALFVKLWVEESPGTHAYFGDNYFFLLPKASRRVRVALSGMDVRQPSATPPAVRIGAWNSAATETGESK
ncbi:MAG: sugar-binding domain-containing protein [bacterium]